MSHLFLRCAAAGLVLAPAVLSQSVVYVEDPDPLLLGMDDAAITPDGHYAIVRENTFLTNTRVYDLVLGGLAAEYPAPGGGITGACADAVACTNERGAVIGSLLQIIDLTSIGAPPIAEVDVGFRPHDLALTPDGSKLVVRGGSGSTGGLFVFDLSNGGLLLQAPGQPPAYPPLAGGTSFAVDSVAVSDEHAVMLSIVNPVTGPETRVTIVDLTAPAGPLVVFETGGMTTGDQLGAPHDLALTPDGQHVAVRSELGVGLYSLAGGASGQVWAVDLAGFQVEFDNAALDSIVVTNDRILTQSRWFNGNTYGTQVDAFDMAGVQKSQAIVGDPHDLTLTPDLTRALVRTSSAVFLYDMTSWPAGNIFPFASGETIFTSHTAIGAGLDSIEATNDRAVGLFRDDFVTDVHIFELDGNQIVTSATRLMPDRPIDVAISPSENFVAVTGLSYAMVFDLHTEEILLEHDVIASGWWPWCNGVVMNDDHVVAFGYAQVMGGWLALIELFPDAMSYCTGDPNSVGDGAELYATGTPSVAADDLVLTVSGLPSPTVGALFYGPNQIQTPFGDGTRCVGGATFRLPIMSSSGGLSTQAVDVTAPPQPAGQILPGATWNFQMVYRDPSVVGGAGFNASQGLSITFDV